MKSKKQTKPKHYCTNENLLKELKIYKETGVKTEELGRMLLDIATRFTNRSNWYKYPTCVKEDFISAAVLRMLTQLDKFDFERTDKDGKKIKPNPFAWFSQICFHKHIMEVKKYYKQINIQRDMCEKYIEEIECNDHMDSNGVLKKILTERVNELN
jgi:hypothetical protein